MACKNVCRLCDRLIISTAVAVSGSNLVVTIPAGSYSNREKYCIVIAQSIPSAATINMPVVIQIGTGTVLYPLTNCNCGQITASGIRTRTKYSTRVVTTPTGGSFRLIGSSCCQPNNNLRSINGTTVTASVTSVLTDESSSDCAHEK
jgi:hypothetical protein